MQRHMVTSRVERNPPALISSCVYFVHHGERVLVFHKDLMRAIDGWETVGVGNGNHI
jgi:hypothetical protein